MKFYNHSNPLWPYFKAEIQQFDPDTQDELTKAGLGGKELFEKKEEFVRKYGPSGIARYAEFVKEQKKKGRELLDKEKKGVSNDTLKDKYADQVEQTRKDFLAKYGPAEGEKAFQDFLGSLSESENPSAPQETIPEAPPQATLPRATSRPTQPATSMSSSSRSIPYTADSVANNPALRQINENVRNNSIKLLGPEKGEQSYRQYLANTAQALSEDNTGGSAASEGPPQATASSYNLAQAPHNNAIYKGQRERFIKDFGLEKGEEAYKDWVERSGSKPGTTQAPSQSNRKELIVDVGDQVDPETGRLIPSENIRKLTAQETARRLANKPYVENPHNKTVELNDLEKAGYGVLHDLVERGRNPDGIGFFNPPRGGGGRALDDFYNQDFKYDKAITLKDKLMENVRANALKRLNKSYEELGHQMSARRMGRNGYEDVLKKEMRENMDAELNMIDSKMAYDLLAQQNQLAGQGVQHVQNQDALEYKKAHDAYVLNKAEEESRKEEQRKNAMNALDRGQSLRAYEQEALNRRSAEFERKNTHHDVQMDKYLDRLRASAIGTPNLVLPDRTQSHSPTFMHNIQPGEPSRMPIGNGAPLLEQVQPDTTMKDLTGLGTAAAGLYLKNKEIDKMK